MQDILTRLACLRRPRLLMRAARFGAEDYRRSAHLPRLLGYGALPRYGAALVQLMEIEGELNAQRLSGDASYCLTHHVDVMIAMVAEAQIMQRAQAEYVGTAPRTPAHPLSVAAE